MYRLTTKNQEAIICIKINEIQESSLYTPADKKKLVDYHKKKLKNVNLKSVF